VVSPDWSGPRSSHFTHTTLGVMIGMPPYPALFLWNGVLWTYYAWVSLKLPFSWSQTPLSLGMAGAYPCTQLLVETGSDELFAHVGPKLWSSQSQTLK
jgi:hypothetical protein